MPKLAHFGCIAAISCHEGVFLPLGVLLGMHQGDILPGIRPPLVCSECASRMLYSKDAPSSARNGPRKSSVQECTPSLSENALQRCFVRGPSSAQANERWLLRCSAHVGLPLRCRGALGDAVLRSFGCWMSPLMRWRWSGRSMSGCRYRCRCGRGCRCCPRCCGVCRAPPPRRLVAASVGGSDAYRAEAEPFTAKRSGTG